MALEDRVGRMSGRNLERTRRVVEAVESNPTLAPNPAALAGPMVQFIARAKVTTAIPTGTFDSPNAAGRAQIYRYNGASWVASGDPVKVYNDNAMPASLPVGRVIKLAWIAGQWWLLTGSCS